MHRNRLNRDVVYASSLEVLKARLRWGFEQPDLIEHIPAYAKEVRTGWPLRSLTIQAIPWFYDLWEKNQHTKMQKSEGTKAVSI